MKYSITYFLPLLLPFFLACATSFQHGRPWSNDEARFFDDGIDIITEPEKLQGAWAFEYEEEFTARINLSDLVALVKINSVQNNRDIQGGEIIRIGITIEKSLYGIPPGSELTLSTSEKALGFNLIKRHESNLKGTQLAFIRFFKTEDGKSEHHFHLSPASSNILKQAELFIEKRVEAQKTLQ